MAKASTIHEGTALTERHPEYVKWQRAWSDYRLLYRGGEELLAAAGTFVDGRAPYDAGGFGSFAVDPRQGQQRRFLWQLEGEPDVKYNARWQRAEYVGYLAAIVDYFRHYLFSEEPIILPEADPEMEALPEPPEWFAPFLGDCNGSGLDFLDFLRDAWLDVLICQRSGWLIGTTAAVGQREAEDEGGEAKSTVLTRFAPEDILDWQRDPQGRLEWVLLREVCAYRDFPNPRGIVETYTHVDRESWCTWQTGIKDEDGAPASRILGEGDHGLGLVPFVMLEIPHGLWPANKLASWQTNLLNQENMVNYGQHTSCFLQPYLKSQGGDAGAPNRVFGEGILVHLRCGDGTREGEEFGWSAADTSPLEFAAARIASKRDEGYRIVHQMALSVDAKAVDAVKRSGESKQEDHRATEVMLCAYGGYVRAGIEETLGIVSLVEGDGTKWSCSGFDSYDAGTLDDELKTAALIGTFDIPSPTFSKKLYTRIAGRALTHLDEPSKKKIETEIGEGIDRKVEAAEKMAAHPPMPMTGGQLSPEDEDEGSEGRDASTEAKPPMGRPAAAKAPAPTPAPTLELTPTALASIVTVDEGRASLGLPPLGGVEGGKWIAEQTDAVEP